ncbi:HD-GYP domain-containing protein [Shewanella maritima]|uniref:HD-GYP domain-containing protein n=1 Tax=Shewanella maritima TaxID=2520507 RepID=UPI003736BB3E
MAKQEAVQIQVSQIVVGMTVKLPLSWTNHPFFLNKVKVEQRAQIELIKGLDVPYVHLIAGHDLLVELPPEPEPEEQVETVVSPDFKGQARKAMRLSQQRFIKCVNESRSIFGQVIGNPEGAYREAATLVENLMEHLHETESPALTLVASMDEDASITQHGISVAVLSMMIAHLAQLSKSELRDIAIGSIFHDIGKLRVPENIRRKRGELTPQEANFLKMHPNFGHDMMSKSGLFPAPMLHIIKHHHEHIDGSGFPDQLKGKDIPVGTQIVSLVNDYESLLARYRSPQIALGVMFKSHKHQHDESLISLLVKVLGIYPPGTIVSLSDGSIAKVLMTTKEVKDPHVWSCTDKGEEPALRFLMEEPDVCVTGTVKLETLAEKVPKTLKTDSSISFYFSGFDH